MHEMTLMAGLLEILEDQARVEGFGRVLRVTLEVGRLAGAEAEALRFAFDVSTRGTRAEGAEFVIEEPAGRGRCPGCGQESEVATLFDACSACGAVPLEILSGRELRIVSLDVE
jgi:hydrogenase nickel incorporation protein HypA/HybF